MLCVWISSTDFQFIEFGKHIFHFFWFCWFFLFKKINIFWNRCFFHFFAFLVNNSILKILSQQRSWANSFLTSASQFMLSCWQHMKVQKKTQQILPETLDLVLFTLHHSILFSSVELRNWSYWRYFIELSVHSINVSKIWSKWRAKKRSL